MRSVRLRHLRGPIKIANEAKLLRPTRQQRRSASRGAERRPPSKSQFEIGEYGQLPDGPASAGEPPNQRVPIIC